MIESRMPQDYLRQKLEELVDPSNHHHLKHTSLYLTGYLPNY